MCSFVGRRGDARYLHSPIVRWTVTSFNVTVHDSHPPDETALVDDGLGEANDAAAPLHEVRPLSCFARADDGRVVGGAVGRWWGQCCELQQIWVEPLQRRLGIGTRLIEAFEARAREHGCSVFYLETFNFQAPRLYRSIGYRVAYEHNIYPHGIVKYVMVKGEPVFTPNQASPPDSER